MGRPREHDDTTAAALAAAERILDEEGLQALSLRRLAEAADTTTRAVYSLFGSKDGLIVALSQRAFQLLGAAIAELPPSADPSADLVEAGVAVFRRFALEHASLFRLAVQQTIAPPELTGQAQAAAAAAMAGLKAQIERLAEAGLLGGRTIEAAACEFHAVCEGLASRSAASSTTATRRRSGATPSAFVAGLARTPSTLTPQPPEADKAAAGREEGFVMDPARGS